MADLNDLLSPHPALFEQHDRLVKLTTPLGDDILLPQRVLAHDRLGRGYEYAIDCFSTRHDIALKERIAQPVALWGDDDIHELLNWTPRGAKKEGQT